MLAKVARCSKASAQCFKGATVTMKTRIFPPRNNGSWRDFRPTQHLTVSERLQEQPLAEPPWFVSRAVNMDRLLTFQIELRRRVHELDNGDFGLWIPNPLPGGGWHGRRHGRRHWRCRPWVFRCKKPSIKLHITYQISLKQSA